MQLDWQSEQVAERGRQMKKVTFILTAVVLVLGFARDGRAEDKVELLALHETLAEFQGIKYRKCMGLTGRCPEDCGSSGEYANFKIVKYLKFEKKGKYGGKQDTKQIRISDFHANSR